MKYTSDYAKSFPFRRSEPTPRFAGFCPKLPSHDSSPSNIFRPRFLQPLYLLHFRKSAGACALPTFSPRPLGAPCLSGHPCPVFSSTYELLLPQALCFHNHLRCRGWPSLLFHSGTLLLLMGAQYWSPTPRPVRGRQKVGATNGLASRPQEGGDCKTQAPVFSVKRKPIRQATPRLRRARSGKA
jgi:hypothetical protein